ncbi:MAG: VCBS repeat-containing protein [Bryobacteraceae bacterium]
MHVADVNGDGKNDVVTSNAHDYGIFWFEQGTNETWTKRLIDDSWSQAHALTLVDLNGDGKKDILTGKRYMAHNGKDPGERESLGIYWYEGLPQADKKPMDWVRHTIDYGGRTGTGMQIPVADLDGDGDLDFAVAGKSGVFLFENLTRSPKR